jgi:YjjG family noncanonical pyrimidine nucleotidase
MKDGLKWIMFDADNTLLDFDKASKEALWLTFDDLKISCTEEIYKVYKEVNAGVWAEFEAGLISAIQLRALRFDRLFDKIEVKPCSGEFFNNTYLAHLVLRSETYEGVEGLLDMLKVKYKLSIITNGLREVQKPRLKRLKLDSYFDSIIVSDEIGHAKPHPSYFDFAYNSIDHNVDKSSVLVVGDNLKSDIIGGLNYGMQTCWISHGKENKTDINPNYEIAHISEFDGLVKSFHG